MNDQKRIVQFFVAILCWMIVSSYISKMLGWTPPPRKPLAQAAAGKDKDKDLEPKPDLAKAEAEAGPAPKGDAGPGIRKSQDQAGAKAKKAGPAPPRQPEIELVKFQELVLGSATDKSADGYRLEVQLDQKGACVESVYSSRFDAEFEFGKAGKRPLELIRRSTASPRSMALTLGQDNGKAAAVLEADQGPDDDDRAALRKAAADAEDMLDAVVWDVVRDQNGQIVRTVKGIDPATKTQVTGQAVVFRTTATSGVIVTKTFRLLRNMDALEVELKFESPDRQRSLVYNLLGPHGLPIEGLWYTGTFRELFFGHLNQQGETKLVPYLASEVVEKAMADKPIDNTTWPLRFAGVENQHFAIFIAPNPPPTGQEDRWDSKTTAVVLAKNEKATQQSDVGVRISSRPVTVGPNQTVVHTYEVYAGPKTAQALTPYGAADLASFHKNQWSIPGGPYIARVLITPTLGFTYDVTVRVARFFGGKQGNYGIAIILLTILVRALMFPLGRKQALMAQKMQALQPHLKAIQEKYKDDKERLTKETFGLYKEHKVNMFGGCLPALIQLPIFVGLWQALNTSFPLRHASFLWIRDLAAPDMLFHLPFEISIPFVGLSLGSWFNLLPFVVVGLMLFQTKLFAPPATTPEAEMQQKMMKFMMVFMGVMFYKVPSGLGIYFITSSLWAIGERLLLPKVTHATAKPGGVEGEVGDQRGFGSRGGTGSPNGDGQGPRGIKADAGDNGAKAKPPGRFAQFWDRVLDEARKDPTYRKVTDERNDKGNDKDRDRDRPRPKPRRR